MTKLISWNVNGIRACAGKGFLDFFRQADADVFCLPGDKASGRAAGAGFAWILSVLELCREKRLFRHCAFYQTGALVRDLWDRDSRSRPGRDG